MEKYFLKFIPISVSVLAVSLESILYKELFRVTLVAIVAQMILAALLIFYIYMGTTETCQQSQTSANWDVNCLLLQIALL